MTMEQEIQDALELAAGRRLNRSGMIGERQAVNRGDVESTRKLLLLFLESLDVDLTVGELREYLDA